jgi:hypothetical protein
MNNPDYLFIGTGCAALAGASILTIVRLRRGVRRNGLPCLLWTSLGIGLILQGSAPHLEIERNRFILSTAPGAASLRDPVGLVAQERRMHLLSALLTGGAALGLALYYRPSLFRRQDGTSSVRTPAAS